MIDWCRTEAVYGLTERDRIPKSQAVVLRCDFCPTEVHKTKFYHYRFMHKYGFFRCAGCADLGRASRASEAIKKKWKDPEYREKQSQRSHPDELKAEARARAVALWADPEYVSKFKAGFDPAVARANLEAAREAGVKASAERLVTMWADPDYRKRMSEQSKRLWSAGDYRDSVIAGLRSAYSDPEARYKASLRVAWTDDRKAKLSESIKRKWADDDYRRRCAEARSRFPKTSYLEDMVAEVLDAYGVEYSRQAAVGPWVFDFLLPDSSLLVEVNGRYWHSLRECRDRAKSTYIQRHTNYKLQVVTEADLAAEGKLVALWGRSIPVEPVNFSDLKFEQCVKQQVYDLFSAFHYMGKPARGGRYFRVTFGDQVVAGIISSPVHRAQVATSIGFEQADVVEIARLVIHPKYQVKNLASWTIARFLRWCTGKYKAVVAFSDTAIHHGTVYKATGFEDRGTTRSSDYEYVDAQGFRLHKKTVWDAAIKHGMKEAGYALEYDLTKRTVLPRKKFVKLLVE